MADAEKEKQEKLAAARKRVEALKKQKSKKAGDKSEKKKDDTIATGKEAASSKQDEEATDNSTATAKNEDAPAAEDAEAKGDTSVPHTVTATEDATTEQLVDPEQKPSSPRTPHGRQPSLSIQSKLRSSSFRQASGSAANGPTSPSGAAGLPPLSPEINSMGEIYRKQAVRVEELERENKRLAKDLDASEIRWRKAEEELEELRSTNVQMSELKSRAERAEGKAEEIEKLNLEIQSLKRQNAHLQSISSKARQSPASSGNSAPEPGNLAAELASKTGAIESMEMEISNLRAQLSRSSTSTTTHSEQVTALEEKLDRAERAAGAAQRELLDARKNLDRASEKALKAGTENTSAQARVKELERELASASNEAESASRRVDNLEKKLTALTNLHKEADTRRRDGDREVIEMKKRIVNLENEASRYKTEAEKARKKIASSSGGGGADDDLEELEDEQQQKLEARVRELESELFEARRGVWRDKRRDMQGEMPLDSDGQVASPSGGFDEVDLSGSSFVRRNSTRPSFGGNGRKAGGLADVLSSGLQAIAGTAATVSGAGAGIGSRGHARNESLALLDDDDDDFDESAFRAAQADEALKRVERVKDIKRGLKDWTGHRIDIVDLRMGGGGGIGEVFDV